MISLSSPPPAVREPPWVVSELASCRAGRPIAPHLPAVGVALGKDLSQAFALLSAPGGGRLINGQAAGGCALTV